MVKDTNNYQMVVNFKDFIKMVSNKVKAHSNGPMDKYIKANGIMVKNMVVVYGKDNQIKNIQENGNITQQKDSVFLYHLMVIDIKESLKIQLNMDMVQKGIIMEKFIQDSLNKIDLMEKDNIIGQMVAIIKESLLIN